MDSSSKTVGQWGAVVPLDERGEVFVERASGRVSSERLALEDPFPLDFAVGLPSAGHSAGVQDKRFVLVFDCGKISIR